METTARQPHSGTMRPRAPSIGSKAGLAAGAAAVVLATGIASLAQQSRVDDLVRADFFAGFAGNADALERGMRLTEELEADPGNAPARVWHGAGTFFRSGAAFETGDFRTGIALWEQGLTEMARAVEMAPDDIEVLRLALRPTRPGRRHPPNRGRRPRARARAAGPVLPHAGGPCPREAPDRSRRRVEPTGRPGGRAPLLRAHRGRACRFRVRAQGAGMSRRPTRGPGTRLLRVLGVPSLTGAAG